MNLTVILNTTMKKENLKRLADWIEKNITQEQFDMSHYRTDGVGHMVVFRSINDCGTVGCLVGWSPFVPKLKPLKKEYHKSAPYELDIDKYESRIFDTNSFDWRFLFSDWWANEDNTLEGAIKRLRFASTDEYEDFADYCKIHAVSLRDINEVYINKPYKK